MLQQTITNTLETIEKVKKKKESLTEGIQILKKKKKKEFNGNDGTEK